MTNMINLHENEINYMMGTMIQRLEILGNQQTHCPPSVSTMYVINAKFLIIDRVM